MKKFIFSLGLALYFFAITVAADDIEVYLNESETGAPYVLLMLDLRSSSFSTACNKYPLCGPPYMTQAAYDKLTAFGNFGPNDKVSKFEVFRAVLASVLENPKFGGISMALEVSNWTDGGTILEGYELLSTGKQDIFDDLGAMPGKMGGNESHEFGAKESYYEWYRYINGGAVIFGDQTNENFKSTENPAYDGTIIDGNGNYIPPFTPGSCPKLFSIVVAMQGPPKGQDDSLDAEITADMSAGAANKVTNMMQWMHATSNDLLTDNVGFPGNQPLEKSWIISDSSSVGQNRDMAAAGGSGEPLNLDDPLALAEELTSVLQEVLSVSSTFVAGSVPENVFSQAESLDNLFVALFEAQETVRWPGNVKKLKLKDTYDADNPNDPLGRDGVFDKIVDVNDADAFESRGENAGRIKYNALTFWTDVASLPDPNAIVFDPNAPEYVPDGVDGRVVDRGGAGQKIPGFVGGGSIGAVTAAGTRQLYVGPAVVNNGGVNALLPFDDTSGAALEIPLDADDPTHAEELIRWGRGLDEYDEDGDALTTVRPWMLGEAIHSRPFALNYGLADGYNDLAFPNIRLFLGTGDGIFHILGNTDNLGNETGAEVFGFYPREALPQIRARQENTHRSAAMLYGVDGAPVVFTNDINSDGSLIAGDGDEAYVYFGMRRGGTGYYALDVSDPSAVPNLAWRITPATPGFGRLGLTFSTPTVGTVKYGGTAVDVVIFAGGYNGGWNGDYSSQIGDDINADDDTVGNAIYIVNARTGALIWSAEGNAVASASNTLYRNTQMLNSIPSDLQVLENLNGNIHRIYVGDTGGGVWRIDLPEGRDDEPDHRQDNWSINKFAQLATIGAAHGSTHERRFFHAPDLVETFDDTGDFDGVLIGSGNRADPTETGVDNYFFYLKDRIIVSGHPDVKTRATMTPALLANQTSCVGGTEAACSVAATVAKRELSGWYINQERSGEKGLSTPLVDAGRVFFTSYRPGSVGGSCGVSEGEGSVYIVNLADGTTVKNDRFFDIGPGIPPGAILIGDVILIPGAGIDLDAEGDGETTKLPKSLTRKLHQIYWREPGIDQL